MMKRIVSLLLCLMMIVSVAAPSVMAMPAGSGMGTDDIYFADGSNVTYHDDGSISVGPTGADGDTPTQALQGTSPTTDVPEALGTASASTEKVSVDAVGVPKDSSLTIREASPEMDAVIDQVAAKVDRSGQELFRYDISVQDKDGLDWQPNGKVRLALDAGKVLHPNQEVYVVHVSDDGKAERIEAKVNAAGKIEFETSGFSTFAGFTVDFEYLGEKFSIDGYETILLSEVFDRLRMPLYVADVERVSFSDETLVSVQKQGEDWLLTSLKAFQTIETLKVTMVSGQVYDIRVTDAITSPYATISIGGTYYDGYSSGNQNGEVTWYLDGVYPGIAYYKDSDSFPGYGDGWSRDETILIDGPGTMQINLQHQRNTSKQYYGGDSCALRLDLHQIKITGGAKVVFRLGGNFSGKEESITIQAYGTGSIFNIQDGSLFLMVGDDTLTYSDDEYTSNITLPSGASKSYFGTSSSSPIPIYLKGKSTTTTALIYAHQGKDESGRQNVVVQDVNFRTAPNRAVMVKCNNMTNLSFTNCTFNSTVASSDGGGPAIYVAGTSDDSYNSGTTNVVDVNRFNLKNCTFSGTSGAGTSNGGAVVSYGDIYTLNIDGCTFKNCTSPKRGGAIALSVDDKTKGNNIYNWFRVKDTKFQNCTSGTHGGAIDISNGDQTVIMASNMNFSGCTFVDCTAGNRGGAIRLVVTTGKNSSGTSYAQRDLNVTDCAFSGCTSGSQGGGISIQGTIGNVKISGSKSVTKNGKTETLTFADCESTGTRGGGIAIWCPTVGNVTLENAIFLRNTAASHGGGIQIGDGDATEPISVGAFEASGCTFTDNVCNGGVGGAISLTDGAYKSVTVTNCSFTDCIANRFGGAIALKKAAEDEKVLLFSVTGNVSITGCDFSGCQSGYLAATSYDVNGDGVVESEWDPNGDGVKIPVLNGGGGGGAIYLGGTYGGTISIKGTSTKDSTFTNCYTWNNGGAIGVSDDVVTKKMDLQYLDINGCRARDGGNAVHFGSCIVDTLTMDNCTVQNCSYFTDDFVIDIPGTEFDSYGTEVYCSYDANGTFRSIGNATVRATISNCEFLSNTSFDNGGGIYWNANNIRTGAAGTQVVPSLTITGTYFYGNHAERDGGGLYVEAKVDIQDCDFESNIADKRGGAIAQQIYNSTARDLGTTAGESNNLILDPDTKIWGNTAINGGGISITVSDSVSLKPKADGSYINYSIKFQLNGATVHDNYASQNGGGIYYSTTPYADAAIQKKVDHFRKEILIDDGSIYNNQSGYGSGNSGNGGGIYMLSNQVNTDVGGYSWLTVTDGQIYSNIANDGNGGGIFLSGKGAVCTITGGTIGGDTEYEANIARMTDYQVVQTKGCGGGIAIDGGASILMRRPWKVDAQGRYLDKDGNVTTDPAKYVEDETKDGGVVSNNKAHIQGAGIWLNNRKAEGAHNSITINGGTIKDNEITTTDPNSANGGGVFVGSYGSLIMNGGSIYGCVAKGWGGGVFCNNHASFTLNGGTIGAVDTDGDGEVDTDGNFADCGGGIAFQSGGTCTIKGGAVQYNESTGSVETNGGGGIFINSATTVDIQGGDVAYNRSAAQGGGIYGSHMILIISGGSVTGNTAAYDGGGIHGRSDTSVTMSGGNVTLNSATDGGGIYLRGSYMNMTDGDIEQNTASGNGGGAYLTDAGTITVEGNISGNRANSGKGGGVYATGSGTEVTVKGDIDGNTAGGNGGGVEIREGGELIVTGGNVQNNTTGAGGGGIHCFDAVVTVNSGNIQNNHAAQYAGGIYVGGASVAMVDGSVQDNTTDGNGGGIHCASDADKAPVLTIYGNVEGNKAVAHGGGVYAKTISGTVQPSITILHGSIMDNHANCAYDENGALRSGSSANTGNGGGVYLEDASLTLTGDQREDGYFLNGMIQNNSAVNGGGVYAIDATITVTGGIRENEAKYVGSGKTDMGLGGGLYARSDDGTTTISMAGNIPYNKAQTSGGGVYLTGTGTSDGTTYKTSFIQTTGYIFDNEAFDGDGGGIMVKGNASADIEGGIIRQNKALKGYGGGINVAEGGNVILNGGTIMANLADHGGGIAAETATALTRATVSGGDITGNYAYYGGGIYA
ncbi:MAG: right-handed parallel beta-helix repeat-containing protein, partial [Oscillospiraceae bacterium]|nr:right-handed parallel beta-helix repeat-containing protein [Oscillospiraceae bacterium]